MLCAETRINKTNRKKIFFLMKSFLFIALAEIQQFSLNFEFSHKIISKAHLSKLHSLHCHH